jgi:hypothetical protein
MADGSMSEKEKVATCQRVAQSTGRRKGRPRIESQYAIRALTLHYATRLSWRQIALKLKGCTHTRPTPNERSCVPCGEATRNAAMLLAKFLFTIGYEQDYPKAADWTKPLR